jgi:hypothetical protein
MQHFVCIEYLNSDNKWEVIFMSKFDKKKIAAMLAFAALFGSKTSATTIHPQTIGAVGGDFK